MASPNVTDKAQLSFRVIRTSGEFDAIEIDWHRVWENSATTVFQAFEWQRTWWRCFGEERKENQLFIVILYDESSIRGIAPLFIEHISIGGILSFRRVSFLGRGVSDYLDIIAQRGYEEDVLRVVLSALNGRSKEYDVAVLEDLPDSSFFPRRLHDACIRELFTGKLFEITQCPRTTLHTTWEETLASFSAKHRKDIAYELRNINRNFSIEFELTSLAGDVQRDMDDFIAMHQERWTHAGHQGVFKDTQQARFHKEVALACQRRGWLFLAFLRLNGKRVAVNYGFHCKDRVMTYLNGMIDSTETARYSPGKILHLYSMQESIHRKCTVYDFMRGRERYKYALGAFDVPNWTLILYPRNQAIVSRKMKLHFLAQGVVRRLKKEQTMLLHTIDQQGLISGGMVDYLIGRMKRGARDSILKVRNPEKNLPEKGENITRL